MGIIIAQVDHHKQREATRQREDQERKDALSQRADATKNSDAGSDGSGVQMGARGSSKRRLAKPKAGTSNAGNGISNYNVGINV